MSVYNYLAATTDSDGGVGSRHDVFMQPHYIGLPHLLGDGKQRCCDVAMVVLERKV